MSCSLQAIIAPALLLPSVTLDYLRRLSIWIPAVTMMLMSLISYIDRNTLAVLAPTILEEMKLSTEQYGFIVSAFSILYMLGNPIWGRWLDRFGLRWGMTAAVGFWTLSSIAHAFTTGFWSFGLARAALGFGEGATFPGGYRTVVETLPPEKRSRGVAVAYSGGSLGAIVTPLIVIPIAAVWGWRGAFWFTGIIGVAWLILWNFVNRLPAMRTAPPVPTKPVALPHITDPRLWSFIFAYAFGAFPLGFVLYTSALYLKTLGLTQSEMGKLLWIPPLGWEVGYFFWGWVTDRTLHSRTDPLPVYRRLFTILTIMSLPLAFATEMKALPMLMTELFLAMFVTAGFVIIGVSYATSIFTTEHAGFVAGLGAGSWSGIVALLMPFLGRLFDQHNYTLAFQLATAIPVAGYFAWLFTSRKRSH